MPNFDGINSREKVTISSRGIGYYSISERSYNSTDPEVGYRPYIYTIPPSLFGWKRWFSWRWLDILGKNK
ncbi:hypothetical protein AMJ44_15585 [candidate division WOR-1 bacterium DG_54_3]|uniref:Uncharacterized protein n=1 Tax=candidate division WOR-1 bacterium DG_54_3 TaxID=1703775 RepID=A0A0S7XJQ2_UNCSA|nr:MAG: hypothetical protein AMJ44_15585 [candidate division WOR-1 bacterium DG_54_3]